LGVQIDIRINPSTAGDWKNILVIDPPPVLSWPWGETWFDNGIPVIFKCLAPTGYKFDHWTLVPAPNSSGILFNSKSNPLSLTPIFEMDHEAVLTCVLYSEGIPPPDGGGTFPVTAQFNRMEVNSSKENKTWVMANPTIPATITTDESSDVVFDIFFTNTSQDHLSHGFRFGLQAVSDETGTGGIIYDPNIGYDNAPYNIEHRLRHTINFITYGANVKLWLESEDGRVWPLLLPPLDHMNIYVDTGVPPPFDPFNFPSTGDPFGDNGFWLWMLIALIVIMTFIGAYGGYWAKKKKLI